MFTSAEMMTPDFENSLPTAPQPRKPPEPSVMCRALDEIDYGLILVSPDGQFQHANHLGRYELARGKFLRLTGSSSGAASNRAKQAVQANSANTTADLLCGVRAAAGGRRQMFTLRHAEESLSLVCMPLFQPFEGEGASVLLMLGRQSDTPNLALNFFARSHKLSAAEEGVLRGLCAGQQIADIAHSHGVAESTVRTQVRALRDKTQCNSIRRLVQQVAALPPILPVSLTVQNSTYSP